MSRQENDMPGLIVGLFSATKAATCVPTSIRGLASRSLWLVCSLTVSLSTIGCGGDLKVAPVSGTVTLDGSPLERASVLFEPETGRPSFGVTDVQGRYTLNYSMNERGAEVGPCTVKISTAVQSEEDEGKAPKKGQNYGNKVPSRYAKDPVKVTVAPKTNTINIALTTQP
ncbi:peptidase associated/transthyretin-like domain-containing protein [Schlesneria paludicola]|uniref:carboxypeptidase-like regulatory domain-containing protein n=1 Tax=Schlesneria paludicola TaxID=360056 RepID=UPI00029A5FE2|nr:carboxypeptidase-like regulatory domain-containing protein [Schlesneria paludicola]